MEMEQSTNAPAIASPAAFGFGPSVAMPALQGMMPEMPNLEETDRDVGEAEGEESLLKYLEEAKQHFTPQVSAWMCGRKGGRGWVGGERVGGKGEGGREVQAGEERWEGRREGRAEAREDGTGREGRRTV